MGSASWQPKWWTEETHGSAWSHVKEAIKRDWEQTKSDLQLGGRELNQDADNTLRQAVGKEPIPAKTTPNTLGANISWDDVEQPLMYGYGARRQYGSQHAQWNDNLESTLRSDWEAAGGDVKGKWDDVKNVVRHGYDRPHR